MEPHTEKQLKTAFKFVTKACHIYCIDDVESFWKIEKENPRECKHPTVIAVRSLLLMMGVDPDVHRDDCFWVNVYESANGDRFTSAPFNSKELADNAVDVVKNMSSTTHVKRIAVKRIKVGDTE